MPPPSSSREAISAAEGSSASPAPREGAVEASRLELEDMERTTGRMKAGEQAEVAAVVPWGQAEEKRVK